MDKAVQTSVLEKVVFSLKNEEEKISETERIEVEEIKTAEVKVSVNERFARLKKSLRKRSVSIL